MHWEKSEPLFHLLQPSMNCDGKNEGTLGSSLYFQRVQSV